MHGGSCSGRAVWLWTVCSRTTCLILTHPTQQRQRQELIYIPRLSRGSLRQWSRLCGAGITGPMQCRCAYLPEDEAREDPEAARQETGWVLLAWRGCYWCWCWCCCRRRLSWHLRRHLPIRGETAME